MEKKEQEVAEEYLSSLADLNLNSKPLINMLTILAEENIEYAPVIVKAVKQHIAKVEADVKLPVLYLIDSIVKNVGREYIQLFSHSIVNIFCGVFEKVNEKVREKMYTLRQTWNDVFTPQKLYTLDVKVNCMDPNWPITAKVPKSPAIHVNPNFLKKKDEPLLEMEARLRDKQRQLLELQKRKLELQLAATKQRLEEQEKHLQCTIQGGDSAKPQIPATAVAASATAVAASAPANSAPIIPSKPGTASVGKVPPGNIATVYPNNTATKIRVAPVNPALLNTVRQRDPRLARQQQQQQAALAAAAATAAINQQSSVPNIVEMNTKERTDSNPIDDAVDDKRDTNTDKINKVMPRIPMKPGHGGVDRDRSKSQPGFNSNNIKHNRSLPQRSHSDKVGAGDEEKSPTYVPNNSEYSPTSKSRSNKTHPTSRGSSMSRNSGRDSSRSGSSRNKSGVSGYDRDRKRKMESSPHKHNDKRSDKSPKRYMDSSSKFGNRSNNSHSDAASDSSTKFRDIIKENIKSRNYMRRNREKSPSPIPPVPPPPSCSQDTDMRDTFSSSSISPEKRIKLSATDNIADDSSKMASASSESANDAKSNSPDAQNAADTSATSVSSASTTPAILPVASSMTNPEKVEQSLNLVASSSTPKDTDLRQLHTNAVVNSLKTSTSSPDTSEDKVNTESSLAIDEGDDDSKKRTADASEETEEPVTKKTKSEKIDSLFGSEDVDLRTLSAPPHLVVNSSMPATPPPPPIISKESESWAKVKGANPEKPPTSMKSKLEDVRAKLAKATKGEKLEKDLKSLKKASRFNETNEDSQDGTDNKIRTIISQAQEMLENDNMDVDQYNTLVKTVIQINETSKLKEAQRRESLLKNEGSQDLTPISDEEVAFSSDDENESNSVSAKSKILSKRIPKVTRSDENSSTDNKFEQSSVLKRSPTPTNGNSYTDNSRPQLSSNQGHQKVDKRARQKSGPKWAPREQNNVPGQGKPKWVMGNSNTRLPFPPNMSNMMPDLMIHGPVPSPWQNPPQMIFAAPPVQTQIVPPPPMPPLINPILPPDASSVPAPPLPPPIFMPTLSNSVDNPNADVVRTINIDGVPKEIRFYDDIAIAFMDWDQPKEIGFQPGQRRIMVDDQDIITLSFNEPNKTVIVDGKPHQMRFGCPTRELYIDNNWYECYFGDPPIRIFLDGKLRVFKIEGPAPQVRIGNTRHDLVVGKINLIIDALIIVPVFLDAKIQKFELNGTIHILQFADNLRTVVIDSVPYDVEYGGLPKSMALGGVKHFIRFATLPNGIIAGYVNIQNMIRTDRYKPADLPILPPVADIAAITPALPMNAIKTDEDGILPPVAPVGNNVGEMPVESKVDTTQSVAPMVPPIGNVNIDELFQKLLSSGILNQNQGVVKNDESKKDKQKDKPITPIDLSRTETIKTRQLGIIQKLFTGMQCSSCGVRFPPEQTMKYSQHLDWHFRQNRKERDNSRRAHSRKWYYEVSDWVQYEEIEDLDEREKNWFETQQNEAENVDENSNQRTNSPPPSCPAGPDDVDKSCDMCHEKFEQFYNEESEEWHVRDAIRVEDKTYHPICYEDFKASLIMEETITPVENDDNAVDSVIVKDENEKDADKVDEKETEVIVDDDDEDDVIVLPSEEPSIQEIPDDDDDVVIEPVSLENEILVPDSETTESTEKSGDAAKASTDAMECDDVEIQEPHIPFTDLDTYEETAQKSISTVDDSSQSSQFNLVKIKEEPKDDGYNEDDEFEEVGTIICDDDISTQAETVVVSHPTPVAIVSKPPVTSSSNSNILVVHDPSSIDVNAEAQDTPTSTMGSNKIKININKSTIRGDSASTVPSSNNKAIETADDNSSCNDNANSNSKSVEEDDDFYNSIQYTLKPSLKDVQLKKVPRNICGVETSGLCSIM